MLDPKQRDRLGRLFDGPAYAPTLAAHVRALEVGLERAAAEYGTEPAALRATFVRWGLDLAPLTPRPRGRQPHGRSWHRAPSRPASGSGSGRRWPSAGVTVDEASIWSAVAPPTGPARVERIFLDREVAQGERLCARTLARELGVDPTYVRRILQQLRALREQDPSLAGLQTPFAAYQRMTAAELAAAATRARRAHAEAIAAGWWWRAAACRGMDVALFFPTDGNKTARAKRVCAACPVRSECLHAELAAPVGFRPDGVFGGTAPWERTALRVAAGTAGNATTGRFLDDPVATQRAHQRASRVGISRAAAELACDPTTLKRAFASWELPPVAPLPPKPPKIATTAQADTAYALACRVGLNAAARQLDLDATTLRKAIRRFELAWPPPPSERPVQVHLVDPVFFALNPAVIVPRGLTAEAASARVRRQEAFEALGARVVYGFGEENGRRLPLRVHYLARRACAANWPEADALPLATGTPSAHRDSHGREHGREHGHEHGHDQERRCA